VPEGGAMAAPAAPGAGQGQGEGKEYPGRLTLYVFLTCAVAATGGLIVGYDIGISGNRPSHQNLLGCLAHLLGQLGNGFAVCGLADCKVVETGGLRPQAD